jgi:hypothetical protein
VEADKIFATIEEVENHLNKNSIHRTEEVKKGFKIIKKFINSYY